MNKIITLATILILILYFETNGQANLFWAKSVGGPNFDNGHSIAIDNNGNVYYTGVYSGTADFDPGPAVFNLTSIGSGENIFVSKLDAAGNLVWAKSMGGAGGGGGSSIAVDANGNVFTTGHYSGTGDFDPGPGIFNLNSGGVFISKLDAAGNFVWAKNIGTEGDGALSIYVDASGNIYTTGKFYSISDFDPGAGNFTLSNSGAGFSDVFVSKLDPAGNFIWAKSMGGSDMEFGKSVFVDALGNVYTTGVLKSTSDFDPSAAVYNLTLTGMMDVFISKLDASGNFVWAKTLAGSMDENGNSITVDAVGNVYTTGYFYGVCDFDPGPSVYTLSATFSQDVFVSKLDPGGNFIWVKQFSGDGDGNSITLDGSGNIYTTGHYYGTVDFDPGANSYTLATSSPPYADIFVCKLDASGNFNWVNGFGGPGGGSDIGKSVVIDAIGDVYVTGWYSGTVDFDSGPGVYSLTANSSDVFVVRLSTSTGLNTFENNISLSEPIVFPNPNNGNFSIQLNNNVNGGQFILTNSFNEIIYQEDIFQGTTKIKSKGLSSGIYFYRVTNNKQTIKFGKLMVQ